MLSSKLTGTQSAIIEILCVRTKKNLVVVMWVAHLPPLSALLQLVGFLDRLVPSMRRLRLLMRAAVGLLRGRPRQRTRLRRGLTLRPATISTMLLPTHTEPLQMPSLELDKPPSI